MNRSIVFLSDFGYRNEWVGICHAVINRIAPDSPIVDLSHGVPALHVDAGALLLADSIPYLSENAVVLAVVDPSVGRDRDIAVETGDGRLLVGPDNGLLAPAWRASGGAARAVSVTSDDVMLQPVSPSFHARDVLAPAAAHLARGMELAALGDAVSVESLANLHLPEPLVEPHRIQCEVIDLNRFGNVQLNVREADLETAGLEAAAEISVQAHAGAGRAKRVGTYSDLQAGEWGLMVDPRGWLAVIRGNPANAAEGLGVGNGDLVWLTEASPSASS
ncbi:MAG TPA: SAM-dependent chlorinase/fluorinase [Gaiellaceae bacterium]|nr:SAM-dependent chlorinase/fluorinase [Gaiellaceae bacterium]